MRAHLLPLQNAGKIDVAEEFRQSCFHITVYKSYVPPKPARKPTAETATTQTKPVQDQTGKTSTRQQKTSRKPAQAMPAQPRPEEPEQQPVPASRAEAPVEGL